MLDFPPLRSPPCLLYFTALTKDVRYLFWDSPLWNALTPSLQVDYGSRNYIFLTADFIPLPISNPLPSMGRFLQPSVVAGQAMELVGISL